MDIASRVRFSGPLKSYAAGFGAELARLGYTPLSATVQLRLTAELSRYLESAGLAVLTEDAAAEFLAGRKARGMQGLRAHAGARPAAGIPAGNRRLAASEAAGPQGPAGCSWTRGTATWKASRAWAPRRGPITWQRPPFRGSPPCPRGHAGRPDGRGRDRVHGPHGPRADPGRDPACRDIAAVAAAVHARPRPDLRAARGRGPGCFPARQDRQENAGDRAGGGRHAGRVRPVRAGRAPGLRDHRAPGPARPAGRGGRRADLDDLDWRAGQITVHGKGGSADRMPLPAVISSFQDRHVVDLGGHVEDGVVDVTAVAA